MRMHAMFQYMVTAAQRIAPPFVNALSYSPSRWLDLRSILLKQIVEFFSQLSNLLFDLGGAHAAFQLCKFGKQRVGVC
jgi:hypothetical protein